MPPRIAYLLAMTDFALCATACNHAVPANLREGAAIIMVVLLSIEYIIRFVNAVDSTYIWWPLDYVHGSLIYLGAAALLWIAYPDQAWMGLVLLRTMIYLIIRVWRQAPNRWA